ncbi:hypothetical protein VE00_09014 [Pseudogymnoascus sp. WSF 3629]|nr:hypothetical protein VE00_09014 [Pseudogymnoascus sp. WSF 3629]
MVLRLIVQANLGWALAVTIENGPRYAPRPPGSKPSASGQAYVIAARVVAFQLHEAIVRIRPLPEPDVHANSRAEEARRPPMLRRKIQQLAIRSLELESIL